MQTPKKKNSISASALLIRSLRTLNKKREASRELQAANNLIASPNSQASKSNRAITSKHEHKLHVGPALMRRLMYKGKRLTASNLLCKSAAHLASLIGSSANTNTGSGSLRSGSSKIIVEQIEQVKQVKQVEQVEQVRLLKAIGLYLPYIEIKTQLRRGSAVRIPTPISGSRSSSLLVRWIIESARARGGSSNPTFIDKLTKELQDILASNPACGTAKKQAEVHKIAEANRGQLR